MKLVQFLSILFVILCYSQSAAAYLDPGTGSLILQMLIAGIIGAMFTIKLYWYRLKAFVARTFGKTTETESDLNNDGTSDKE
jgi:hypothetical protein